MDKEIEKSLIKFADFLDKNKKHREANYVDFIIKVSGEVYEMHTGAQIPEEELHVSLEFPDEFAATLEPNVPVSIPVLSWPDEEQLENLRSVISQYHNLDDDEKIHFLEPLLDFDKMYFNVLVDREEGSPDMVMAGLISSHGRIELPLATGASWAELISSLKLILGLREPTERESLPMYAEERVPFLDEEDEFVELKEGKVLEFKPIEYSEDEDGDEGE